MELIYDTHDKPKFKDILLFSIQQILAILTATIIFPKVLGLTIEIPAAILGAGVGTLTYVLVTKRKSPVLLSSAFSMLPPMMTATLFGYLGIIVGALFGALVYIIFSIIIHFVGTKWIEVIMPTAVIGPVVVLIGLSLAKNIIPQMAFSSDPSVGGFNAIALLVAVITFFTVMFFAMQTKFKALKGIPFVMGVLVGLTLAIGFTAIGYATKVNYLKLINVDEFVSYFFKDGNFKGLTAFLDFPRTTLFGGIQEIINHDVSDEIKAVIPNAEFITPLGVLEVAIAFVPIAFITVSEHIADHKNLGYIINKDLLRDPGLSRTLMGDGLGSITGTLFGISPNTTYGESIACVATTGNASIITIIGAAIGCILISFVVPITAIVVAIPNCVLGGVVIVLYGFVSLSGLKMIQQIDLERKLNFYTMIIILIVGVSGIVITIPYTTSDKQEYIQITSLAIAFILGVLTYQFGRLVEKRFPQDNK